LSVILIHVASLNDRKEDVPELVDFFLQEIAGEYNQPKKAIDAGAVEALKEYNWTGNIRELRNVVERLVILSGKTIQVEDVHNYVLPG
jgi:DNA-binding NtrC family response regulator